MHSGAAKAEEPTSCGPKVAATLRDMRNCCCSSTANQHTDTGWARDGPEHPHRSTRDSPSAAAGRWRNPGGRRAGCRGMAQATR
jgi:hypothetical protein